MKKILLSILAAFVGTVCLAGAKVDFVPLPQEVEWQDGAFVMDRNIAIDPAAADAFNVNYLKEHLDRLFEFPVAKGANGQITFAKDPSMGEEEYSLTVSTEGIKIVSSAKAGEFYAIQTLMQMLPADVYKEVTGADRLMLKTLEVPAVKIHDFPRFPYRGSMLDVARTFFEKDYLLRHIDYLAYHKINKFHIHLADDTGWRVEMKKYPLLTTKGAWRGYGEALHPSFNSGTGRNGGFYTQAELKEVVAYAKERNVEIIPEIDLPGHSKAVMVCYPELLCESHSDFTSVQGEVKNVYCVGSEKTYKFLEDVVKELSKIFPSEYFHIGGDEVVFDYWRECPLCQDVMKREGYTNEADLMNYFVRRMEKILAKYNKKLAGWEEIVKNGKGLDNSSLVFLWKKESIAETAVNEGRPVVVQLSPYCYIDMKHTEAERGYTWAGLVPVDQLYSLDPTAIFPMSEEQKKLIVGPQAGLWGELLQNPPHFAEYQMFPRLCALAEVGWTNQELRNYDEFDARLTDSHFERLYDMGIKFRLPYPEVSAKGNLIYAESAAPSLVTRYTMDGSEPKMSSPVFAGPIVTDNAENLRFATFYGTLQSISVGAPGAITYLTPETKLSSSMPEDPHHPLKGATDYDPDTYFQTITAPEKGDWILFEFTEPLSCKSIEVNACNGGSLSDPFSDAHVEISYDGRNFSNIGKLDNNDQIIIKNIENTVKAVKVVADGPCEFKAVSIQDLKIVK